MATNIRPETSEENRYHISKHRYYELKHFCLQYYEWKQAYQEIVPKSSDSVIIVGATEGRNDDPTGDTAVRMAKYAIQMEMVEETASEASARLGEYLFKAVTEDLSFTYLKTRLCIPCERDMYYDRYRRFFWLLDKKR